MTLLAGSFVLIKKEVGQFMQAQNDGLRVSVLASGSTGNCTYIETAEHKILIDAGLSGKKNRKSNEFNWA